MRLAAVAVALLVSGCAPGVISGTEAGGIVGHYGWQPGKSLQLANAHCEKFGKAARVSSQNDLQDNMTFDCVTP